MIENGGVTLTLCTLYSKNRSSSVYKKESGLEEAIFKRADHRIFETGRGRYLGKRAMPEVRFQRWLQQNQWKFLRLSINS